MMAGAMKIDIFMYICQCKVCFCDDKNFLQQPSCRYNARYTHIYKIIYLENMKNNRAEYLHIRVSKEEKDKIANIAKKLGVSLSTYTRKSLLRERITSKTDIQTIFEIKKIGVNLNQLAKHINTLPLDEEIVRSLSNIDNYINELKLITDNLK